MWIFTDVADAIDEWKTDTAQDTLVNFSTKHRPNDADNRLVGAGKATLRGGSAAIYISTEVASELWVDPIRIGDGFRTGTVEGITEDLFRGVSLLTGGIGGRVLKYGAKGLKSVSKALDSSPKVIKAQKEYLGRVAGQIGRTVPMVVKSGRVYTNLAFALRSRGISTLRYEVTHGISDLVSMLKQARIIRYFKSSRINRSVDDFARMLGQDGSLVITIRAITPDHRYLKDCIIFKDIRGRARVQGDKGTYFTWEEYHKAEFGGSKDVKFDRLTDVQESHVIRDVKFDFSQHRRLTEMLVNLEGVVLNHYDPYSIVEQYIKDNPNID